MRRRNFQAIDLIEGFTFRGIWSSQVSSSHPLPSVCGRSTSNPLRPSTLVLACPRNGDYNRYSAHSRTCGVKANWFGVAVDLLIVVIGVFLGMQANNWNEARVERQQEESYRYRLIEDLRTNKSDLRQRRAYYSQVRRHSLAALDVLERPSPQAGEQFLIDAFQATQIIPRTLTRFTYDEMIAVGGV